MTEALAAVAADLFLVSVCSWSCPWRPRRTVFLLWTLETAGWLAKQVAILKTGFGQ